MASPLARFEGDVIYLDTNVLVGFIDADSIYHTACAAFFQRAVDPDRPIQLITATLTLDEVIFVLLQELVAREPYTITQSRSQYLRDHPEVVKELMTQVDPLAEALHDLVILEPVTAADMEQMRSVSTIENTAVGMLLEQMRCEQHLRNMARMRCVASGSCRVITSSSA
jgi:predicted nucleic acid-binding protein